MYKIIVRYKDSCTKEVFINTYQEGINKVAELCKLPNVKGVPYLTPITKMDIDMQQRQKEWDKSYRNPLKGEYNDIFK